MDEGFEVFAEQFAGFQQTALLIKGDVVEVVYRHFRVLGDLVLDFVQPGQLFGLKLAGLLLEPGVETGVDQVAEGFEHVAQTG